MKGAGMLGMGTGDFGMGTACCYHPVLTDFEVHLCFCSASLYSPKDVTDTEYEEFYKSFSKV